MRRALSVGRARLPNSHKVSSRRNDARRTEQHIGSRDAPSRDPIVGHGSARISACHPICPKTRVTLRVRSECPGASPYQCSDHSSS